MKSQLKTFLAAAAITALLPAAALALMPYSQDFEGLDQGNTAALAEDGWLVFGNVFAGDGTYLYGYGPFDAPNDGGGFCQIATGEGGAAQGMQQLNVFSDYNNTDHAEGNLIEANVFQEMTVMAENVTETWVFDFQAKRGNLEGQSTALAFIKTIDPDAGFATTNFVTVELTDAPTTWQDYTLSLEIDASLEGQILQIGFQNTATNYEGSGVFYDNIDFYVDGPVAVQSNSLSEVKSLFQ
jgi:hypothetical protein